MDKWEEERLMEKFEKLFELLYQECLADGKYHGRNYWRKKLRTITNEYTTNDVNRFFSSEFRDRLVVELSKADIYPSDLSKQKKEEMKEDVSNEVDDDVLLANVQLRRKVQKLQDTNRIERKGIRHEDRLTNALEESNNELITLLKTINLSEKTVKRNNISSDCMGIIHLSDLHLNELINLKNNKYDFNIASKRLKLLADKATVYFQQSGVTSIAICSTGDLLNKDDILDKLLNNATNRMKACLLATSLISQFILDLNQNFKITFVGVTGNETRMAKDIAWTDIIASDNYDLMLYNMLSARFLGSSSVLFHLEDPLEQVIDIAGNNVLLIHGHQFKSDLANGVKKVVAKYAYDGIIIDYVLSGHLHEACVSDNYSRGASMCGQNAYSDKGLQLSGRASQNIGIFFKNKNRDIIKIDLQNYEDIIGYPITKEIEAYNAKSHDKLCSNKTIFKIVI